MQIRCGTTTTQGTNATVVLDSGDHLSVAYTDPRGECHMVNISAQHLVFIISDQETDATMIYRPAQGIHFIPADK